MILAVVLLSGAATVTPAAAEPAAPTLYRIELAGNSTIWSQDRPQQSGALIVFHRYPDGVLMSVRSADVKKMAAARPQPTNKQLAPGQQVDIGLTGSGSASAKTPAGARGAQAPLGLGERKDGTALLNPDRTYRPDWDSKLIPGLTMGNPNSPNDYREGRTFGYPSAPSSPIAPGDLPRAKVETGDPKSNQ
ncbi:MAG TPA: hypothetical protein VF376_02995 [Thermoanaerobaculia bacterium]